MATEKQLLKLEKIEEIYNATEKRKDVPKVLANGRIGYQRAIQSIMKTGEWAAATLAIAIGIAIIILTYKAVLVPGGLEDHEIFLGIIGIISCIVSGVLGYKLWSLEATPIFAIVSLLIILFVNIALCFGILPIITATYSIIAIARYSTFCSWFNKFEPKKH